MPYATKITADTEKYWCGIKHKSSQGHVPAHHAEFLEYGDKKSYQEFLSQINKSIEL